MKCSKNAQQSTATALRPIELTEDLFALVFTVDEAKNRIAKVESFMPPYDDLAPHVYMFVSYLSLLAGDEQFFHRILSESFAAGTNGEQVPEERRTPRSDLRHIYRTLELLDNQIAIILRTDSAKSCIRSSWMLTTSFNSRLIYVYMFAEHLCSLCRQSCFFNEILFEGFNRLFVVETDAQQSGAPKRFTSRKRGSEHRSHIVLKENQLGIILTREEKRDAIKKVTPIIPSAIDPLSNVYAFVQSLAVLVSQDYFFKKILVSGMKESFFNRRRMVQLSKEATKSGLGYQVIMLGKRQYAIIFTADMQKDVITNVKTVFSSIDAAAPRVFMFLETLTSFMARKFAVLHGSGSTKTLGSTLRNGCPC